MPRICPNCSERFSMQYASRVSYKRSYREAFMRPLIRCPKCGAILRRANQPVFYALLITMLLSLPVVWYLIQSCSGYQADIGLSLYFLVLFACIAINEKWGYRYEVTDDPEGLVSREMNTGEKKKFNINRYLAILIFVGWIMTSDWIDTGMPYPPVWALLSIPVVTAILFILFLPTMVTGKWPSWKKVLKWTAALLLLVATASFALAEINPSLFDEILQIAQVRIEHTPQGDIGIPVKQQYK